MTVAAHKQLIQTIFFELSRGNDQPFIEAMAEDMTWNWMGSGQWSRSFKGKPAVLNELWAAVKTTLTPTFKVFADLIIAEGNHVVIEARGENTTPDGKVYNNKYCWICRMANGKIEELNEYMDTELVTKTFN